MLRIKEFSEQIVIITDGKNEYILIADGDNKFDIDILEDILNYTNKELYINENKSN